MRLVLGAAVKGVGGRAAASPFGAPHMPHVPGSPGSPPGMPTSPVASKFSRKAHGGRRHGELVVKCLIVHQFCIVQVCTNKRVEKP